MLEGSGEVTSVNGLKPLGMRAYGSIGHLPGSRTGPSDRTLPEGQVTICTSRLRNKHDRVIVTEKLDGSNCCVALLDGNVLALGRAGYLAATSPYELHHRFSAWVAVNESRFRGVLTEGERVCGEWLAQAHGTLYDLPHEPYVIFDIMRGHERMLWDELVIRVSRGSFVTPCVLNDGRPLPTEEVGDWVRYIESGHGAIGGAEGAVWRVETTHKRTRERCVDFLGKWVRPDKVDGCFLPEVTGGCPVWNWRPSND